MKCTSESLCSASTRESFAGRTIAYILDYSSKLSPDSGPDFERLRARIREAISEELKQCSEEDVVFDWVKERITWCTPDGQMSHEQYS